MKIVRVRDISSQIRGVTYNKSEVRTEPADGYIALLRGGNIGANGVNLIGLQYVPAAKVSDKQMLKYGDVVVVASSGSLDVVGKAAAFEDSFDGTFGAFCKVLRPTSEVDQHYFAHYFKTPKYRRTVSSLAAGANINNLKNEHLDGLEFPLPELSEQRRIAAILDKVDTFRSKRRETIAHLDALGQSIFDEMFAGLSGDPLTLRDASLRFVSGRNMVGTGVNAHPIKRVLKVNAASSGEFDGSQVKALPLDYDPPAEHRVEVGDLIVTRASGTKNLIGVATLVDSVPSETYLPDKLWKAVVNPELLLAEYFRFLTRSTAYRKYVSNAASGAAGVSNISQAKLLDFRLVLPPIERQGAFAERIAAIERLKTTYRAQLAELDNLFLSLQGRAFTGEL